MTTFLKKAQLGLLALAVVLALMIGTVAPMTVQGQAEQTQEAPQPEVTEVPVIPTEVPPTAIPTEIIPETTPIPTAEVTESPTVEITPEATDVVITPTLDPTAVEPGLTLLYSETFASGAASEWSLTPGWTFLPSEADYALRGVGSAVAQLNRYDNLLDVAVQTRFMLASGAVKVSARQSVIGSYTVELAVDGTITLYRAEALLQTAAVAPIVAGEWHTLQLAAIADVIKVTVDNVVVMTTTDATPLPPGKIALSGNAEASTLLDDVQIFIPADQPIPPTAVYTPAAPTPEATLETTPEATPGMVAAAMPVTAYPTYNAPQTFIVNNRFDTGNDGFCTTEHCTLREAMWEANANVGYQDTIAFAIVDQEAPPYEIGIYGCKLPDITDPIIIDGYTQYPAQKASSSEPAALKIELNGNQAGNSTTACPAAPDGLKILAGGSGSVIQGLAISRFKGNGIAIVGASNVTIQGNFIGLQVNGVVPLQNDKDGIHILNGDTGIVIGGNDAQYRNIISGNGNDGIEVEGVSETVTILGNYIGTDKGGTLDKGNKADGIFANDNILQIGGENRTPNQCDGDCNVISGNDKNGIEISNLNSGGSIQPDFEHPYWSKGNGTIVEGNFIGVDYSGTWRVPNTLDGIFMPGTGWGTLIGGAGIDSQGRCIGPCNVITGNNGNGIQIAGITIDDKLKYREFNFIQGNIIGLSPDGQALVTTYDAVAKKTYTGNKGHGVYINAVAYQYIGNDDDGVNDGMERNIISGNVGDLTATSAKVYGIYVTGLSTSDNKIWGNYIGPNSTGTIALGNRTGGIELAPAISTWIGGFKTTQRNVISGNNGFGIEIVSTESTANRIRGNFIGTTADGLHDLGNLGDGVRIISAADNFVGDFTNHVPRNVISGNEGNGVYLADSAGAVTQVGIGNRIQANYIGLGADGTTAIGNTLNGVLLTNGATENQVGLDIVLDPATDPETHEYNNVIAHNGLAGVAVDATASIGNMVMNNIIYSNGGLGIDLGATGVTPNDVDDADTGPNNLINFPVLTDVSKAYNSAKGEYEYTINAYAETSTPNRRFRVDFFANTLAQCDPSGYGEAANYLGSLNAATVLSDSTGRLNIQAKFLASAFKIPNATYFIMSLTEYDNTRPPTKYSSSEFSRCIDRDNNPPTISDIPDQTTKGSDEVIITDITVTDIETPAASLVLTASTSNGQAVPVDASHIWFETVPGQPTKRTMHIKPNPALNTQDVTITVTVTDGGGSFASDSFNLHINANLPPTINPPAENAVFSTAFGQAKSINFTIGDPDDSVAELSASTTSEHPGIVPASTNITCNGTACTVVFTPVTGQTGSATLHILVNDGDRITDRKIRLDVTANTAPKINGPGSGGIIATQTTVINTPKTVTGIVLTETEVPLANVQLTVTSDNPTLLPNDSDHITSTCTPATATTLNCTLTLTPADGQIGSTLVTATVSDGYLTASRTFTFTVSNAAPTITGTGTGGAIPNVTTVTNTAATTTVITIDDAEATQIFLSEHATATSSDQAVLANANITVTCTPGSTNSTCTIRMIPGSTPGTATITFTVTDGYIPVSKTFTLTVNQNEPPCINRGPACTLTAPNPVIAPQTTKAMAPKAVAIVVGDKFTTPKSNLVVTATSSNTTLVPDANIVVGAIGTTSGAVTLTITPVGWVYQDTTTNITVRVYDGALFETATFTLTVQPGANTAPTITGFPAKITTTKNVAKLGIPFTIGDAQTAPEQLTVTATSSNTALVPNSNIVRQGTGADRTLNIAPAANQIGQTTITVTVTDIPPNGQTALTKSASFVFEVIENTNPRVTNIPNQVILIDTTTADLPFSVDDTETQPANLVVTATSDNTTLVPNNPANIVLTGAGSNRFIKIVPAANQSGSATITVEARDEGGAVGLVVFRVTVTANTPPTISDILDRFTTKNTPTGAIPFTVDDTQTPPDQLVVTATSSNPAIVPNDLSNIWLGGSGKDRTITVTPATGVMGTVIITVTVTDGHGNPASDDFALTITENNPPTITAIEDIFTAPTTSTVPMIGPITFLVNDPETDAADLVLSATSSNPDFVPEMHLVFGGTSYERTLTIYPPLGQSGDTDIIVTVTDGAGAQANEGFTLSVQVQPPVPNLPAHLATVTTTKPAFSWSAVPGAKLYRIEIAEDANFTNPVVGKVATTSFTPPVPLSQRVYYWRVKALNASEGNLTPWSNVPSFTLSLLKTPANRSFSTNGKPSFTWYSAFTGATYKLEIGTTVPTSPSFTPLPLPPTCLLTATSCTLTDAYALPQNIYYWRVKVNNDPTPIYGQFTITGTPPVAPVLSEPLTGVYLKINNPTLKWAASLSSTNPPYTYEVQVDNQNTFASPEFYGTGITDLNVPVLPGLTDGVYYWRVRTVNSWSVPGGWSAVRNFTVDTLPPNTPVLSTPANGIITNLTKPALAWKAATGASSYKVTIATDPNFANAVVGPTTVTSLTFTVPAANALSNGTYYWRVIAVDKALNESPTAQAEVRSLTVNIQVSPTNGSYSLSPKPAFRWNAVKTGDTYTLQIADFTDPGFTNPKPVNIVPLTCVNRAVTSCTLTGDLIPGRYWWRVNVNGINSPHAWLLIRTPSVPKPPVQGIPVNNGFINDNTPMLTWSTVTDLLGAVTYEVQVDNDATFVSPVFTQTGIDRTYQNVNVLLPDGKYYWRVRTINLHTAPSAWTASRYFTVDLTAPGMPQIVAPENNTLFTKTNRPTLSWRAVAGANRYRIDISTNSTFTAMVVNGATVTTVSYMVPTALALPNGTYYWRVRAIDAAGNIGPATLIRNFTVAMP